jgi:hypothetical protein
MGKGRYPILQLTPRSAAKQAGKQQSGLQGLCHSASHPTRPPMRCTWGGLLALTLCQTPSRGGHQPPRPLAPPRHVCVPRIVYAEGVRAHVRAVHTHTGILYSCFSFFLIHVTVLYFDPFDLGVLKFNSHHINVPSNTWSTKYRLITYMSAYIRSNLRDESIKPN